MKKQSKNNSHAGINENVGYRSVSAFEDRNRYKLTRIIQRDVLYTLRYELTLLPEVE